METLTFIFYLGIVFTIFQALWWLVNGLITYLRGTGEKTAVQAYILKSLHYILLMPVVVGFVTLKAQQGKITGDSQWFYLSIAIAVTAVYLFGKIQRREKVNRFRVSLNQVFKNAIAPFNFKAELVISIIAIAYLVLCFLFPILHENGLINWITKTIAGIYDAFLIGLIFKIIGFVFVVRLFWKLITGIRSLFGYNPDDHNKFDVHVDDGNQSNEDQNQIDEDAEYTDYEEVD